VVAVVRKVSGWDLGHILQEYRDFAEPKVRDCDINYITGFELAEISNLFKNAGWQFRTRNFIRATLFALFVLIIWLFSGVKMAAAPKRKLEK
jgi:tyrosine-protein phosphatase SIW14